MTLIDPAGGFASQGDLAGSGVTTFNGSEADVTFTTPEHQGEQSGNLFANGRVNIQDFSTTFTFQMQPPTSGPLGDGLSFIIQNHTGHRPAPDFGDSTVRPRPPPRPITPLAP